MFYHCGQHLDYDICLLLMGFHVVLFDSEGCHLRWPTGLIKLWVAWLWFRWSSTGTFNHSQIKQPSVVQPQSKHGVWDLWDKGFRWYPYKYSTLFHNIPIINAIVCPFHPNHLHIFRWVSPPSSKNRRSTGQVSCRPCSSGAPRNHRPRYLRGSSGPCRRTFQVPGDRWKYHPNFPKKSAAWVENPQELWFNVLWLVEKQGTRMEKKATSYWETCFGAALVPCNRLLRLINQPTNQPPNHPTTPTLWKRFRQPNGVAQWKSRNPFTIPYPLFESIW